MGTRAVIARVDGDGFTGRYHHWDGYPSGLGKSLYALANGHFKGKLPEMMRVLCDEHPVGWSTIVGADFGQAPGYTNYDNPDQKRPQCYCHGDRHESDAFLVQSWDAGACGDLEWGYAINERTGKMFVYENDGGWRMRGALDLNGEEPNWSAVEGQDDDGD